MLKPVRRRFGVEDDAQPGTRGGNRIEDGGELFVTAEDDLQQRGPGKVDRDPVCRRVEFGRQVFDLGRHVQRIRGAAAGGLALGELRGVAERAAVGVHADGEDVAKVTRETTGPGAVPGSEVDQG